MQTKQQQQQQGCCIELLVLYSLSFSFEISVVNVWDLRVSHSSRALSHQFRCDQEATRFRGISSIDIDCTDTKIASSCVNSKFESLH